MKNRFTLVGAAALVAALALFGASLGSSTSTVHAGGTPFTSTPMPSATPCGGEVVESASMAFSDSVAPTCTPVTTVRTSTPTSSPTSAATNTPVATATTAPATVAPANTAAPATATSPSGGELGAVSAPNTGTGGDGAVSGGFPWLALAGIALAAAGLGSLGYGVRKRG